jgi:penicillin-binding protein 2
MPEKKQREASRARLNTLAGFLLAVLLCYAGVLYNTQIVHGQEYLEQSVRTITKQETVEASRGIITDRYGRELVSNRQTYNLTFDAGLLNDGDDENASILRLIQLCRSKGLTWSDNLPITSAPPYAYQVDSVSNTQKGRFVKFLQSIKLVSTDITSSAVSAKMLTSAGLTADILVSDMRQEFAIPADWSDADARAVLGVLYELSVRKLVNTSAYVMVEDIDSATVALLNDGRYAGAKVTASSVRQYQTDYAAHILGSVGRIFEEDYAALKEKGYAMDDLVGKSGTESAFEDYLRGTDGTRVVSTNSEGKITSELYSKQPKPGDTVELTIDLNLQKTTEDALAATVSKMTAADQITRGAGAAVIQVGTGDILALASYPTYSLSTYAQDYNTLKNDPANPLFDRATQGTYPPGSTFKPCTAVAALESGAITPETKILDKGIYTYYAPTYQPKCWIYSAYGITHGWVNVTKAITVSCNYFFYEVGRLTGIKTLNEYSRAFGLGEHTGIEIGDSAGTLAGPDYAKSAGLTWTDGQTIAAAIGQSYNLFTPLQLSNYIATLVSGGKHYPAHLLKEVKTYDNSNMVYAESNEPENDLQISDSTLKAVKEGMHALTTPGGSLYSYFSKCVVDAGAKTGTAQLGSNIKNNGVFICFAPYDKPQIAVAIVIEKGGSGSALASTAVEILNSYFSSDEIGAAVVGENELLP